MMRLQLFIMTLLFFMTAIPLSMAQTSGCSKQAEGANCRKICRSVQDPTFIFYEALLEGACGATQFPLILSETNYIGGCQGDDCNYIPYVCIKIPNADGCDRVCSNGDTGEILNTLALGPENCNPSYELDPNYSFACTDPEGDCKTALDGGSSSGGGGSSNPDPTTGGGGSSGGGSCGGDGTGVACCSTCTVAIPQHHVMIRDNITENFKVLRRWMITQYFIENILPALQLMAEQLATAGMYQVEAIGALLDAKHQLETERLFQQLMARAHKDYQPSEGMCTFGTIAQSLAQSDRKFDMAQTAITTRMMHRQTLNGESAATEGQASDNRSRLKDFITIYCDRLDNEKGLTKLCPNPTPDPERRNIDINYTRNIETRLTLDMEFANTTQPGGSIGASPDKQDVFALASNLFANRLLSPIAPTDFGEGDEYSVRLSAAERYLRMRSVFAKRSVAQNSFAAIVGMRTAGDAGAAPYVKAVMRELGVKQDDEIEELVGSKPSYFAQMEVLTKKLYQNPLFYSELYDKPSNIERKGAALQAIGLMQDRDLYDSLLRSEAVISVLIETQLMREQEKITNEGRGLDPTGGR